MMLRVASTCVCLLLSPGLRAPPRSSAPVAMGRIHDPDDRVTFVDGASALKAVDDTSTPSAPVLLRVRMGIPR